MARKSENVIFGDGEGDGFRFKDGGYLNGIYEERLYTAICTFDIKSGLQKTQKELLCWFCGRYRS